MAYSPGMFPNPYQTGQIMGMSNAFYSHVNSRREQIIGQEHLKKDRRKQLVWQLPKKTMTTGEERNERTIKTIKPVCVYVGLNGAEI